MGVMASYCQLCGLPVQHDHYVATERPDSWSIYRSSDRSDKPAVAFGPEHEWLTRGVALELYDDGEPAFGSVEDGHLEDSDGEPHFVAHGRDDRAVFHVACWELAGSPRSCEPISGAHQLHAWVLLSRYQEQLFEFEKFIADGLGAWLIDPNRPEGAENRRRIEGLVAETRRVAALPPVSSASQLAEANCWNLNYVSYNGINSFWRHRDNFKKDLDLEGRDWKHFCVTHKFEGEANGPHSLELERFEVEMLKVLKPLGVVITCRGKPGLWDYMIYTDRAAECESAVRALGRECDYDTQDEPNWDTYFKHLHPHLAGRWEDYEIGEAI